MSDLSGYRVGFDFHRGRPIPSIVGKIVPGQRIHRRRGEVGWSGVADCKLNDWYRLVRSPLGDENERCGIVLIEWGVVLIACYYPVFHIEGN